MLSFNRRPFSLAVIMLLGVSIALGACGYRPLYGPQSANPQTTATLAQVEIKPINDRAGQMMRTALQRRLSPRGQTPAQYYLQVSLKESISKLAVERDSFATRANLSMSARYQLVRIADGLRLTKGQPRSVASYNILTSNYATLSAEADARNRAIEALADDIQSRLAIYFAGTGGAARP